MKLETQSWTDDRECGSQITRSTLSIGIDGASPRGACGALPSGGSTRQRSHSLYEYEIRLMLCWLNVGQHNTLVQPCDLDVVPVETEKETQMWWMNWNPHRTSAVVVVEMLGSYWGSSLLNIINKFPIFYSFPSMLKYVASEIKNICQPERCSGLSPTDNHEALATPQPEADSQAKALSSPRGPGPFLPGQQQVNLSRLQFVGDGQKREYWPALCPFSPSQLIPTFVYLVKRNKKKDKVIGQEGRYAFNGV